MHMNARSPSVIRRDPGFAIRDRDWTINGPIIGPAQRHYPRWPSEERTPLDRRNDYDWPRDDRRTPRVPEPEPDENVIPDDFPYISPTQPAACWLI